MEEARSFDGGRKRKTKSSGNCEEEESKQKKWRSEEEISKRDFIHVRARRGQATDSHSLAERARREKISQRMKYLQDLVPGCNKVMGKALMLDEIINYVQSLQRQVEFLSMKLATVNPHLGLNFESLISKEMQQGTSSLQEVMTPFEYHNMTSDNGPHVQLFEGPIEGFPQEHTQLGPHWVGELHGFAQAGFDQSAEILYPFFPSDQMKTEL